VPGSALARPNAACRFRLERHRSPETRSPLDDRRPWRNLPDRIGRNPPIRASVFHSLAGAALETNAVRREIAPIFRRIDVPRKSA